MLNRFAIWCFIHVPLIYFRRFGVSFKNEINKKNLRVRCSLIHFYSNKKKKKRRKGRQRAAEGWPERSACEFLCTPKLPLSSFTLTFNQPFFMPSFCRCRLREAVKTESTRLHCWLLQQPVWRHHARPPRRHAESRCSLFSHVMSLRLIDSFGWKKKRPFVMLSDPH